MTLALVFGSSIAAKTAEKDQAALKQEAAAFIARAAAKAYDTDPHLVEVRMADRRLVLPSCEQDFRVSFPFNDRATAQLDCPEPAWRAFVQIRLTAGTSVFVYQNALPAGHALLRSDIRRAYLSKAEVPHKLVEVVDDVLGKPLIAAVAMGDPIQEDHFEREPTRELIDPPDGPQSGWMAATLIPRGNRLSKDSFQKEIISGRVPTDLVPLDVEFELLETTRNIMPGEVLRQSAVKLAPAVRKGQELPIIITRGALTVSNTVRILQDAAVGDAIDAINVESGRRLKVKVVAIEQVELM